MDDKDRKKIIANILDQIPGGLGDNRPDEDFDKEQLEKGTEIEMEHTDDPELAKEITKDHLTEVDNYYITEDGKDRLHDMEEEAKKEKSKKSDRRKYNPDGHNEYTAPKHKPPRYDLRNKHKTKTDPLDKKDNLLEENMNRNRRSNIISKVAQKEKQKGFNTTRENMQGFKYKDKGIKSIAETYKHLAEAFKHIIKANNTFASCKSSQISPDGRLGGNGYVQDIKEVRGSFSDITNLMSELIDTFHDEVNSPYWKRVVLEEHPAVKDILDDSDKIIDEAEELDDEKKESSQELSADEKKKIVDILKQKKW